MTNPVLQAIDLSKRFGALQAVDGVSLDVRAGEIHALIGPNGAGKSTLIQQIAGSLRPDSGTVMLADVDVTNMDTVARAKMGLARTFQVSALAMEDTVLQNVFLGAMGAVGSPYNIVRSALKQSSLKAIAEQALNKVGLIDQSRVPANELSHGQRRQLEIAIALTMKPTVFVMDEPMAGLGTSGSKQLTLLLDKLREQAPILLVEHDMDAVFALADRISVLVHGSIIASGPVDEIRSHAAVREAYLGKEA